MAFKQKVIEALIDKETSATAKQEVRALVKDEVCLAIFNTFIRQEALSYYCDDVLLLR